jgi:hypothetical protein
VYRVWEDFVEAVVVACALDVREISDVEGQLGGILESGVVISDSTVDLGKHVRSILGVAVISLPDLLHLLDIVVKSVLTRERTDTFFRR